LEKYKKKLLSYKSKLLLLQAQNSELLAKSGVCLNLSRSLPLSHSQALTLTSNPSPGDSQSEATVVKTKLHAYKLKLKHQNEVSTCDPRSFSSEYSLCSERIDD
jgi:hypothetical protein